MIENGLTCEQSTRARSAIWGGAGEADFDITDLLNKHFIHKFTAFFMVSSGYCSRYEAHYIELHQGFSQEQMTDFVSRKWELGLLGLDAGYNYEGLLPQSQKLGRIYFVPGEWDHILNGTRPHDWCDCGLVYQGNHIHADLQQANFDQIDQYFRKSS